jgi:hypothetical protein
VSSFLRLSCLVLLLLGSSSALAETGNHETKIRSREKFSKFNREQLADKLRKITGWSDLAFDQKGALQLGKSAPVRGSATARRLLAASISNPSVLVLEDASKRKDVVFCRVVVLQKEINPASAPVYLIQIDFADFDNLIGDRPVLDAFNVGWGFLHELDHVISASFDSRRLGHAGECEDHINRMRRELSLPERSDYFFTYFPHAQQSDFITRFVRLPFDQKDVMSGKQRRFWLMWDAAIVGGLDDLNLAAEFRTR